MAAGDIGQQFPDTDPRYRGADSAALLAEVVRLVEQRGGRVAHVDVTILAEQPKLAPVMEPMRRRLATLLSVDESHVGVKAKTMEGLGAIGAGEAIAALAVALVDELPPRAPTAARRRGAAHPSLRLAGKRARR
jgi:2-C-methyl-D-erythritol 2,4-cyclodiphosphate synthase